MNPEKLHDALNQLPDDLLEETDALRRTRRSNALVLKRLVPMAACLVLVLGALYVSLPLLRGGSKEFAMMQGAAPAEPEAAADTAPAETPTLAQNSSASAAGKTEESGAPMAPECDESGEVTVSDQIPVTAVSYCTGSEEPDELQISIISSVKQWEAYLSENLRLAEATGFENVYGESYFADNQLIVLVTTAASSSVRYEFDGIRKAGTGVWELTGWRIEPEWFTDDMEQQHILVQLPRMVEPEDSIIVNLQVMDE